MLIIVPRHCITSPLKLPPCWISSPPHSNHAADSCATDQQLHQSLKFLSRAPTSSYNGATWPSYCDWRAVPIDSEALLVMTLPLTVWYGAKQVRPNLQQLWQSDESLVLLVAGASQEVALRACCSELLVLWRDVQHINIIFAGPDVHPAKHNCQEQHVPITGASSRRCDSAYA